MTSEIPQDHEIQEVWRNNKSLRTVEGCIALADAGDRHAIDILMGSFIAKVENGRAPHSEVLKWAATAFLAVLGGESADVAFGLRPGPGGKRPKRDSKALEKRAKAANLMFSNSSPDEHGSVVRAVRDAADKFGISESDARKIYDAYKLD